MFSCHDVKMLVLLYTSAICCLITLPVVSSFKTLNPTLTDSLSDKSSDTVYEVVGSGVTHIIAARQQDELPDKRSVNTDGDNNGDNIDVTVNQTSSVESRKKSALDLSLSNGTHAEEDTPSNRDSMHSRRRQNIGSPLENIVPSTAPSMGKAYGDPDMYQSIGDGVYLMNNDGNGLMKDDITNGADNDINLSEGAFAASHKNSKMSKRLKTGLPDTQKSISAILGHLSDEDSDIINGGSDDKPGKVKNDPATENIDGISPSDATLIKDIEKEMSRDDKQADIGIRMQEVAEGRKEKQEIEANQKGIDTIAKAAESEDKQFIKNNPFAIDPEPSVPSTSDEDFSANQFKKDVTALKRTMDPELTSFYASVMQKEKGLEEYGGNPSQRERMKQFINPSEYDDWRTKDIVNIAAKEDAEIMVGGSRVHNATKHHRKRTRRPKQRVMGGNAGVQSVSVDMGKGVNNRVIGHRRHRKQNHKGAKTNNTGFFMNEGENAEGEKGDFADISTNASGSNTKVTTIAGGSGSKSDIDKNVTQTKAISNNLDTNTNKRNTTDISSDMLSTPEESTANADVKASIENKSDKSTSVPSKKSAKEVTRSKSDKQEQDLRNLLNKTDVTKKRSDHKMGSVWSVHSPAVDASQKEFIDVKGKSGVQIDLYITGNKRKKMKNERRKNVYKKMYTNDGVTVVEPEGNQVSGVYATDSLNQDQYGGNRVEAFAEANNDPSLNAEVNPNAVNDDSSQFHLNADDVTATRLSSDDVASSSTNGKSTDPATLGINTDALSAAMQDSDLKGMQQIKDQLDAQDTKNTVEFFGGQGAKVDTGETHASLQDLNDELKQAEDDQNTAAEKEKESAKQVDNPQKVKIVLHIPDAAKAQDAVASLQKSIKQEKLDDDINEEKLKELIEAFKKKRKDKEHEMDLELENSVSKIVNRNSKHIDGVPDTELEASLHKSDDAEQLPSTRLPKVQKFHDEKEKEKVQSVDIDRKIFSTYDKGENTIQEQTHNVEDKRKENEGADGLVNSLIQPKMRDFPPTVSIVESDEDDSKDSSKISNKEKTSDALSEPSPKANKEVNNAKAEPSTDSNAESSKSSEKEDKFKFSKEKPKEETSKEELLEDKIFEAEKAEAEKQTQPSITTLKNGENSEAEIQTQKNDANSEEDNVQQQHELYGGENVQPAVPLSADKADVQTALQTPKDGEKVADSGPGKLRINGGKVLGGNVRGGSILGGVVWGGEVDGGEISGGEIRGGKITNGYITGGIIKNGTMKGGKIKGGEIDGGEIDSGLVDGGVVSGGIIEGGHLVNGSVEGGIFKGGVISGGSLKSGEMDAGELKSGSIEGGTMKGGIISGGKLLGGTMLSGELRGGVVESGVIKGGIIDDGIIRSGEIGPGVEITGGVFEGGTIISNKVDTSTNEKNDAFIIAPPEARHLDDNIMYKIKVLPKPGDKWKPKHAVQHPKHQMSVKELELKFLEETERAAKDNNHPVAKVVKPSPSVTILGNPSPDHHMPGSVINTDDQMDTVSSSGKLEEVSKAENPAPEFEKLLNGQATSSNSNSQTHQNSNPPASDVKAAEKANEVQKKVDQKSDPVDKIVAFTNAEAASNSNVKIISKPNEVHPTDVNHIKDLLTSLDESSSVKPNVPETKMENSAMKSKVQPSEGQQRDFDAKAFKPFKSILSAPFPEPAEPTEDPVLKRYEKLRNPAGKSCESLRFIETNVVKPTFK